MEDPTPCIFESDATAIKTFVREMVTQSVVPFMERLSANWNEQVASRRRGISGRFISLSKRFAPFSSSRTMSGTFGQSSSGSSYDSLQGYYRPDTPEAVMRKLADFAFMLRDIKLAQSTYDSIRADYNNDKAWKHQAGASEMAALSTLLGSPSSNSKSKLELTNQLLETAYYSYITRCGAPYYALRSLALSVELLKLRGSSSADDAARWASRIIEGQLVGSTGNALFTERVGACFGSRKGIGSMKWGARKRKALWAVLATEAWLKLERIQAAERCLNEACTLYSIGDPESPPLAFEQIRFYIEDLQRELSTSKALPVDYEGGNDLEGDETLQVEEVSEKLDNRSHRKSLIGGAAAFGGLDASPLSSFREKQNGPGFQDDHFE
jgi:trafficking protein particle complex subunit 8